MNIFANTVVTLTFDLFEADGTLLESASEPITYLHGGYSGMLPKLEEALNHKQAGDAVSVSLEPADAFGDYDAELVKIESADRFPAEIEVGMQFEAHAGADEAVPAASSPSPTSPTARSCSTATIRWAGKSLRFDCRIVEVRPATAEEIEHGHVHGHGGHHH